MASGEGPGDWNEGALWSGSHGLASALCVSEGIHNSCCFCSQQRAPGKVLLDAVCNHLNLVEGDYFGLEFPDHKKITVGDVKVMLLLYSLFDEGEGRHWDLSLTIQNCTQKGLFIVLGKVMCAQC